MSQFVATVDRFEGEFAVLKHKDHEILLPTEDLPEGIAEGDIVTIITTIGKKEKKERKKKEEEVKEKAEEAVQQDKAKEIVQEVKEDVGIVTPEDKLDATFRSKPFTQKVQEVFNDILQTSIGQSPTYQSPEEKEAQEVRDVGEKIDEMNRNIAEEIREHKLHE